MEIKWKKFLKFEWFKRVYVLYIFGFVLNFRPSFPFLYEFFVKDKHFSENEVTENILPMVFYSTSVLLVPVFLLMEFFKYNPFIIISTLTGIVSTCLYIWTDSFLEMQVAQAFYGCMTAAELAYYVSIYSHGDVKTYQRQTAFVRAAPLLGKSLSSFLAQLLVSAGSLTYKDLHYFNLAIFIIATILSIFLPSPEEQKSEVEDPSKITSICSNLTQSFPNKYVVKWSIWSILTICGYNQIMFYCQPLWKFVQTSHGKFAYNGVLQGISSFLACFGTILAGFATFDWKYKGDLIVSMTSLVEAFMLFFMSQITNPVLNSMFYVFLEFMFHFTMTVLSGEIAKFLKKGCFGLVFGINTMMGWALSSAMVCLVYDSIGPRIYAYQHLFGFMFYGFYHLGVSVLYIVIGLSYWFAKHTYQ